MPEPSQYSNRFIATGGRGDRLNFASAYPLDVGLVYGAVSGQTNGGFSFNNDMESGYLEMGPLIDADGSVNQTSITSFAYLSIHELGEIGKGLAANYYSAINTNRVYSYFQGCSEGGREALSQAQRYSDGFDGIVVGSPAMSQSYITPTHMFPQTFQTLNNNGYTPRFCELAKIINDTVAACDALDGRVDGVVARSDLCDLQYNATASIGTTYSCGADDGRRPVWSFGVSTNGTFPTESGTVTAEAVQVYQAMLDGPYDSQNRHLWIGYLPGGNSVFDGTGSYNNGEYGILGIGVGNSWVQYYLNGSSAATTDFSGITADTQREWIAQGIARYGDTLDTNNPDLSGIQQAGGKIIHYHGEADTSVPTRTSFHYHDSVRQRMFPNLSYNDGVAAMNEFYRFYLIPGAQHCAPQAANAGYPDTVVGALIDWVEGGDAPNMLNGTTFDYHPSPGFGGTYTSTGFPANICLWPTRPQYNSNDTSAQPECVMPTQDQLDVFFPPLDTIAPAS